MKLDYNGHSPREGKDVFIAPGAKLIGKIFIGDGVSIWYNVVARADVADIEIGSNTNIQDNTTLHCDYDIPLKIGSGVTVGHGSILHGCHIEDDCLIGMGSTILNNARIGKGSIVGAGALIPEDKEIPPNSLVLGMPGEVVRETTEEELENLQDWAEEYRQLGQEHFKYRIENSNQNKSDT